MQFGLAFLCEKNPKTIAKTESRVTVSVELTSEQPVDRLSKNGETQQVKTATMRVYTFTARKMWFTKYRLCVCIKNCFLMLSCLQIHIILFMDRLE